MKKLALTILMVAIGVAGFFMQNLLVQNDELGTITIEVYDQSDQLYDSYTVSFSEEDTLLSLMDNHYNITCANASYQPTTCDNPPLIGSIILGIDTVDTDWFNTYIAIYINGEYSSSGIDLISLTDGTTYTFKYTEVGDAL